MKRLIAVLVAMMLVLSISNNLLAQDPDTLDVAQGYETLNLAVEGDTLADGTPANPNRVFRLERGGYYLLNGAVRNTGNNTIRIVAADGEGALPILIPTADETGASTKAFQPRASGVYKNLYVSGIDNLGNGAEKNMFRCDGKDATYWVEGCFLDHDLQSFFRMNAPGQSYTLLDCIFRNSMDLASTGNGRIWDTRGNLQESIVVKNCTGYMTLKDILRNGNAPVKNFYMDHCTFYQTGNSGNLNMNYNVNTTITNSIFIDCGWEGREETDSLDAVIRVDTLATPELSPELDRVFVVKNNVHGFTPELQAWYDSIDSLYSIPFLSQREDRFFATYPKFTLENTLESNVPFADAPDPALMLAFVMKRWGQIGPDRDINNPDPSADRNGVADLMVDPASMGPAPDEYNFDYATSHAAYTWAQGGFPAGDLNWFPDKKAEWETWITAVDENRAEQPVDFSLSQNFPNPFNPSTTIRYRTASKGKVELSIHNMLGQKVRTLVNESQTPGDYKVEWNGTDDMGQKVSSGMYLYRLSVGNDVQTRKMLLMK